jgi:hypothetical protein
MYKNYTARIIDVNQIEEKVNDLTALLDNIPYLISFAISNSGDGRTGKTDYKVYSRLPAEVGLSLYDDKFAKFSKLYDIPFNGNPVEEKDIKIESKAMKKIVSKIDDIIYFCKEAKIPCFIGILKSNTIDDTKPATKYVFNMVFPDDFQCDLYDDRINKTLRYTNNTNAYPDVDTIVNDGVLNFNPGALGKF